MKSTFEINDPSKLTATLTIETSVGDFMDILTMLEAAPESDASPLYQLKSAIKDILDDAKKHFYKWT
jgi:hypothetical protein